MGHQPGTSTKFEEEARRWGVPMVMFALAYVVNTYLGGPLWVNVVVGVIGISLVLRAYYPQVFKLNYWTDERIGVAWLLVSPIALIFALYEAESYVDHLVKPDEVTHIEAKLAEVQDTDYRRLVASVIYAIEPKASLSVGALEYTPDGTRTVDVELRSVHDGIPTLVAIDIINLPVGRKVGITAVDFADSKRLDIKADTMLLCSNTGFDDPAIKKAKRKRIGLISVLRRGDKRIKAVIEEEIYLRRVNVAPVRVEYVGATEADRQALNRLRPQFNDIRYHEQPVDAWLEERVGEILSQNPYLDKPVAKTFRLKTAIRVTVSGSPLNLVTVALQFTPRVQWLSQIIHLDATTGIYDYVHRRVRLATGNQSITISGINFNTATPIDFVPMSSEWDLMKQAARL